MLREQEGIKMSLTIQVDTMCRRIPCFIEKSGRANVVSVFIGLESINPDSLKVAGKKQNKITEYRLDRRSGLAIENPLIFYPRRWWEFMRNHAVLLSLLLKYGRILKRIKADANAMSYTDFALTPVTGAENDSDSLELLAQRQEATAISA